MKSAIYFFHPERKQKKRNIFERIRFLEKKTYKEVRLIFQSIDHINTY